MTTLSRSEVLKLSLNERIQLVEDIWDSIVECPDVISLTESQKLELERRLDEYHRIQTLVLHGHWFVIEFRIVNE